MEDTITVVKVSTTWCKFCRVYSRAFEKAREDMQFNVEYVDGDEQKERVESWGVDVYPTTVILRNGEFVDKMVGAVRLSAVKEFVGQYLGEE